MLLKCEHYLQVMVESKLVCAYQIGDVESNLNIFEQTPNTSEPLIEIVIKEILTLPSGFQKNQVPFSMVGKT